jgi:glycine/D-amino acid oxidase-like deaminating enzyme
MARPDLWAGDVLIVGAGAVGVLLAQRLAEQGCSVTLMDEHGLGAGQSNHSHGYMHQGYIYVGGGERLSRQLRLGARAWKHIHTAIDNPPVTARSTVAFSDRVQAHSARATWSAAELPVHAAPPPAGWDEQRLADSFRTSEVAYDFTPFFVAAQAALPGVTRLRAHVQKLHAADGAVQGVDATLTSSTRVRLRARTIVLAAGAGNPALARSATRFRGRAVARMSYMAIAAGTSLPPTSMILPGNTQYGLFVVSRPLPEGGNAWLISNFVSLAHGAPPQPSRRLWLKSALATVGAMAPALRDPSLKWGLYDAPKGELRDRPGEIKAHSFETFNLSNLVVAAPTKLTLAPLLVDDIVAHLAAQPPSRSTAAETADGSDGRLPVIPERWLGERLVPIDQLCEREACEEATQAVWAPMPALR